MDFPTRNLYRTAVEQLARGCRLTELEVADAAVAAARRAYRADAEVERRAPGGSGLLPDRRRAARFRNGDRIPAVRHDAWPGRFYRALGIGGYVGAGAIVAAVLLAAPLSIVASSGVDLAMAAAARRSWDWSRRSTWPSRSSTTS